MVTRSEERMCQVDSAYTTAHLSLWRKGRATGVGSAIELLHEEIVHGLRVIEVYWKRVGNISREISGSQRANTHHDDRHEG